MLVFIQRINADTVPPLLALTQTTANTAGQLRLKSPKLDASWLRVAALNEP